MSQADIDAILYREQFGHLACTDEGKPYIVPLAFVYDGSAIYGQAMTGKKLEIVRRNPLVCFQVQQVDHRSWRSVQLWGEFEELDFAKLDTEELVRITTILSKKIGSIQHLVGFDPKIQFDASNTPVHMDNASATIFRILIQEQTGRYHSAQNGM